MCNLNPFGELFDVVRDHENIIPDDVESRLSPNISVEDDLIEDDEIRL